MASPSVRDVLIQTYALRRARNPAYSMRAFARDIKLSPSRLCEVMKPGHRLSRESAAKIAERMGMSKPEGDRFCDLADSEHPNAKVRKGAESRLKRQAKKAQASWADLEDEALVLTSWTHLAVLELLDCEGVAPTAEEVARRLGLSPVETAHILEMLIRLRLVRKTKGRLVRTSANFATSFELPSAAVRKLHEQLLAKAVTALHQEAFDRRSFDSLVLALPKEKLPLAKQRIREFIQDLNHELGLSAKKDEVYCIGMQMHPLTKEMS